MSRFNSQAYSKLYPREPEPVKPVETAVETFTPTKDKLEGKVEPDRTIPDPVPEVPDPELLHTTDDVDVKIYDHDPVPEE